MLDPYDVLRATYLDRDEFGIEEVDVGGRSGYFVGGTVETSRARWAEIVDNWVDSSDLADALGNRTAAGVLLLPTVERGSGRVWAICFGMGFHLIDSTKMVPDLGRRLAARCADPDHLRSITHSRLDSRAFVARTSIPGGDNILGFGASELGDLISRIVGPAQLDGVLAGESGDRVEIRGADAVNIPLARDAARLLADLDAIEILLERDPIPELATIEQLRALKSTDPIKVTLDAALDSALGEADASRLGLAWPTELADEAAPLSYFVITGVPSGLPERGVDLGALLDQLRPLPGMQRVARLDRMRVQAFSDDDDAISSLLPARRWLSFETAEAGHRYCMHDGRWFMVDDGLDQLLTTRLNAVFAIQPPFSDLPPWPADVEESEYNVLLAEHLGGVCLDRRLVQCRSMPRGFESCDVLTPDGTFVHVKMVSRSTGASHLFAQAGVSAQVLLEDSTARSGLLQVVQNVGGNPDWIPDRPERAVLVMGSDSRLIDPTSLFSFSRMRLARLADECRRQGVVLAIVPILRVS
jgi:uncharacterized protein (TIGR04141 family)